MNQAALVGVVNRIAEPHHHRCSLSRAHAVSAGQVLVQVLPVQAFHRDVGEGIGLAGVVDRDDAGVTHRTGRLRLAQEIRFDLRAEFGLTRKGDHLDGHFAPQHGSCAAQTTHRSHDRSR